jgi:uncharacterized protein (TIGR02996 family)
VTTEDDFHRILDDSPADWHTRLVFADWLDERGDPRGAGYRAIARRRRRPLQGRHLDTDTWWWHSSSEDRVEDFHNHIPTDWFAHLPRDDGNEHFWPVFRSGGGIKSRRECEDALARAFAKLPAGRQTELLAPPKPEAKEE